jgi:hypothetical protein
MYFPSVIAVHVCPVYPSKDSPCGPIASHDWTTNRKIPLRSQRLCGEPDFESKEFSPKTPMKSRELTIIPHMFDSSDPTGWWNEIVKGEDWATGLLKV